MSRARIAVMLAGAVLFIAGCEPAGKPLTTKEYEVVGKVVAVDADAKTVTLDHEDIPGYMNAMEMPFNVEDPKILTGIAEGDQVKAKLEVRSGSSVITSIHKR